MIIAVTPVRVRAHDSLEDAHGSQQQLQLRTLQRIEISCKAHDTTHATFRQESRAARRGADHDDSSVALLRPSHDEPFALQCLDQACHRRRAHLLGGSEGPEGDGATENDHGEGGEAGRAEPRGVVLPSEASQEMDCGRMQAVRDRHGLASCVDDRARHPHVAEEWFAQWSMSVATSG